MTTKNYLDNLQEQAFSQMVSNDVIKESFSEHLIGKVTKFIAVGIVSFSMLGNALIPNAHADSGSLLAGLGAVTGTAGLFSAYSNMGGPDPSSMVSPIPAGIQLPAGMPIPGACQPIQKPAELMTTLGAGMGGAALGTQFGTGRGKVGMEVLGGLAAAGAAHAAMERSFNNRLQQATQNCQIALNQALPQYQAQQARLGNTTNATNAANPSGNQAVVVTDPVLYAYKDNGQQHYVTMSSSVGVNALNNIGNGNIDVKSDPVVYNGLNASVKNFEQAYNNFDAASKNYISAVNSYNSSKKDAIFAATPKDTQVAKQEMQTNLSRVQGSLENLNTAFNAWAGQRASFVYKLDNAVSGGGYDVSPYYKTASLLVAPPSAKQAYQLQNERLPNRYANLASY
jgi:uncharacterized protein YcfJ